MWSSEVLVPLQETVMNHTTEPHSASGARQLAGMASHIARELNRYDAHLRDVRGLTTQQYIETDLAMKERALARLHEPVAKIQRYTAPDSLLAFLRRF